MENKILIYVGGVVVVLLLLVGTIGMMNGAEKSVSVEGRQLSSSQNSMTGYSGGSSQKIVLSGNSDLDKYRSDDIPADCRLPSYDNDVVGWAEHMGHHPETQFCLEYYADVIASQNAVDSSGVPLKCQVPSGKSRSSWIEHLGHHPETKECLKYFEEEVVAPVVTDSSGMPEKCKLPAGKDEVSWKEHLGHHLETKECLKYF